MRTGMLCLNGIGGPERVRYSCIKTQKLRGNLISFLTKVLSGTCDLGSIKGDNKDYLADFLKGKKTIPKGFLSFLLDIISIEDHLLPSRASIKYLYNIFWLNPDFIFLLKEYHRTPGIIVLRSSFWSEFYKDIQNCLYEDLTKIFLILQFVSKPCNDEIWCQNPDQLLSKLIVGFTRWNDNQILCFKVWIKFLEKFPNIRNLGMIILKTFYIRTLHSKMEKMLNRLLPVLFSSDETDYEKVFEFFAGIFLEEFYISDIVGLIYYLLNLFSSDQELFVAFFNLFCSQSYDLKNYLSEENRVSRIILFKRLIKQIYKQNTSYQGPDHPLINDKLLTTLYIICAHKEKMICSIDESEKRMAGLQGDFHEKLFISLFVRYEIPWFFIRNLIGLFPEELAILFKLLEGKNLKEFINPGFTVTRKDIHRLINTPRHMVEIFLYHILNRGLLLAKFDGYNLNDNIRGPVRKYLKDNVSIDYFIAYQNSILNILDFLKRNETIIGRDDLAPLLDFLFNRENIQQINRLKKMALNNVYICMLEWHVTFFTNRHKNSVINLKWEPAKIEDFHLSEGDLSYHIVQLTTGSDLYDEGYNMHHCVSSYADRCASGICSIWSLREERNGIGNRRATIEVRKETIVQIRKKCNRIPDKKDKNIIKSWAEKEGLKLDI